MKKEKIINTFKATKYIVSFVFKEFDGKKYIFFKGCQTILSSLIPVIYTVFPGLIINELIVAEFSCKTLLYTIILTLAPVLHKFIEYFLGKYCFKLSNSLRLKFETDFYSYVMNMDFETTENPDIQIKKERASDTIDSFLNTVDQVYSFVGSIITLFSISLIVYTLNPFIVLFICTLLIINTLYARRTNKKTYEVGLELSEFDKYNGAYYYMLNYPEYSKEVRLFGIKDFLLDLYKNSKIDSNRVELKHFTIRTLPSLVNCITNFIQQFTIYIYLIYKAINGSISIGNFTIYLSAANQFSNALGGVFNSYLTLANNTLAVNDFIEFMRIENVQQTLGDKSPVFDENSVIEFVNVSFKYPGSDKYALKNVNLVIRGKEKLCIVGENGSGKSTFVKLLSRLYIPTEGEIKLNGINICQYNYNQYLKLFAPVFQDYAKYYTTLEKNISFCYNTDKNKLQDVCLKTGLLSMIEKLKHGYDTQIGKWIDSEGVDLSGGEEQRIAIARACYRGGHIYLLDEPTAALDPITEYEIYTQFNELITDKCAVLITHRLSAVQLADKVAVFENGSVVEYGTHKELYDMHGIYTEMFDKQAKFYRDNGVEQKI